ncbi:hypothetical protein WR25_13049 [Diploscapter pachys]|uniref:7TM GPCR serpentine receptor class x (Srx) domain-containing protein n=1 Tax=Diploscapter pachys TaxID=2018661 RepID=A0A2A2JUI4_9BILA|nr:hypothetical protein WR25_13049 [Diploscapter pachys]
MIVLVTILYIFFKMLQAMKDIGISMSFRSKRLQIQYFRALTLQFFVPLGTAFIPVGIYYFCPLFGIELGIYSNIIVISFSFQLLFDGCITLFIITDYRRAVLKTMQNVVHFCIRRQVFRSSKVQANASNFTAKSERTI